MRTRWILDDYLLSRSVPVGAPPFPDALVSAGCTVTAHSFDPRTRSISPAPAEYDADAPAVVYGSFPFVRHVLSLAPGRLRPGAFMRLEEHSFHRFAAHHGDLLLNGDFHMLPFGELRRRAPPADPVFLRPDRVTKSFTGFVIDPADYAFEISCLERNGGIQPEELVIVAPAREIETECRFVIADGAVVAGSTYGWADGFKPSPDTPGICRDLAVEVAGRQWQPDTVYTCDVAVSEGRARLVELNCFSCSGLYACDTGAVAEAVTACALDEYGGG